VQAHNLSCEVEDVGKLKQSEQLYHGLSSWTQLRRRLSSLFTMESWFLHDVDRTPERRQKARNLPTSLAATA